MKDSAIKIFRLRSAEKNTVGGYLIVRTLIGTSKWKEH